MSSPPLEPPFDHMSERPFSFFPPINGMEHNEWLLRQVNWSEILVANKATDQELWIPRRYFGDASRTDDPVLIVGLTRELEYAGGMLRPFKQRLLKMPPSPPPQTTDAKMARVEAASMMHVRSESSDRGAIKMIGIALGIVVVLWAGAVTALHVGFIKQRVVITTKDQTFQTLNARDDRFAVVSKIGRPSYDRFKEVGTIQYEALSYPDRQYTVILGGQNARDLKYIGTVDDNWRPVHFISNRSGGSTEDLLRTIQRF
ncbi:MAG TPA: hypothetical protein VMU19_10885 [Bryobacteraceae bacterium]|nr:hypothetical protein [Bryobacteraceae bacterium]